ncbi:MAG: hypothetical protein HY738_15270 [Bacteroidia bacterium]|nr:hypothetical protein [Bacteroidia bacterium]
MKTFAIILVFSTFITYSFSQENDILVEAFSSSYTYETNGEYTKGIDELEKVYD